MYISAMYQIYVCLYITVGKMLGAVYRYWYVYKRDT